MQENCDKLKQLLKIIVICFWRIGMGILALQADERVTDIEFTDDMLCVQLMDGRQIRVPLAWYPRLFKATSEQLKNWEICGGGYGIHWEDLDEDLNTEGLLRGSPAPKPSLALA
jgi:Protein of unknown function (DUF2442)